MKKVAAMGFALALSVIVRAQSPLPTNAPKDQPISIASTKQAERFNQQIAPFVSQARKTWPDVRTRFQSGLPKGQILYVTVGLRDIQNRSEMVFLEATALEADQIRGILASDILLVKGYKKGDRLIVNETTILDWTISKPDGSEEGNVVGKFLDSLQKR